MDKCEPLMELEAEIVELEETIPGPSNTGSSPGHAEKTFQ
jgi:hypothetical protein